jgi:DNA adenine methylase
MRGSPLVIELTATQMALRTKTGMRHLESRELIRPPVKPVLKWAGGKQWLAPAAPHLIPDAFTGRYYEPFLGGGAIFFAVEPGRATLSDKNDLLIRAYAALRGDPNGVIRLLSGYPHDQAFYYRIRARSPKSARSAAARLFYLNRTCWNGLYRVNREGGFNTPFGRFEHPTICDRNRLRQAARLLKRAKLLTSDFEEAVGDVKAGDFVYFDPPYITSHQDNGFLKYNASLFSWDDQRRLARVAVALARAGVHVLVSNAAHDSVISLYSGFFHYQVTRRSLIGGARSSRGKVSEALLSSYALLGRESEVV